MPTAASTVFPPGTGLVPWTRGSTGTLCFTRPWGTSLQCLFRSQFPSLHQFPHLHLFPFWHQVPRHPHPPPIVTLYLPSPPSSCRPRLGQEEPNAGMTFWYPAHVNRPVLPNGRKMPSQGEEPGLGRHRRRRSSSTLTTTPTPSPRKVRGG